jgi:hypothetical protein
MPDILSITPPAGPAAQPFQNNEMPNTDVLDTAQHRMDMANLGASSTDYAQSLGDNQSITDLINDVTALQAEGQNLLNNYSDVPNAPSPGGFNPEQGWNDLASKLNPEKRTLQATNTPVVVGTESGYNRYKDSRNFQTFGYNEEFGSEQEYKYGRAMTWEDTVGTALGGFKALAANTFVEGWKGWGRMTEALFTWDASKLMGSQEERYQMAKEQEDLMNKYAIYDTETSKDSIWNRQFFGTMLQQSGFAVGAGLQFAMEEFLTMGAASFLEPALKGSMLARTAKNLETAAELKNATRKVMNTITTQAKVENAIVKGLKAITPGYKSVEELSKLHKAGAGFAQLAFTGLGGVRRGLSEFNMARSESIMEAAGTYKQLQDKLVGEYTQKNGKAPEGAELESIKQTAENASHDNFWTNIGVLSVMNRIQYDNMFKSFSKTRSILSEGAKEFQGKAFSVSGKIAGKDATRVYQKGLFGSFNSLGKISKEFGGKTARWEASKSIGRGLMKFEGSEGVQELLQTASDKGLEDYYYDLYHGKKGYGSKMDAVLSNIQNPITDMEGMKTFLMGALTGRLIAPMSAAFTGISTKIGDSKKLKADPNYKNGKQQVAETVGLLNKLYEDPAWFQKEALASIKVNNKAAETMEVAAANHNKYVFNNHKDSSFAKTVAAAIKLDMYDSLRDSIKEFGSNMSDEEFQQAFGIDPSKSNKGNVKNLANQMVAQVEDYYNTFNTLKDEYGDKIVPELYKYNKPEDYLKAKIAKRSLDAAIEMIATNSYKAKQAIVRASNLQTEITANKNIGSSSLEVLTKLGSVQAIQTHIAALENEISNTFQAPGTILTKEQKEILRDKKDELRLAKDWEKHYMDTMENDSPDYTPTPIGRAYDTFAKLVTLFNKRSKIDAAVSKMDVDENFIKLTDYIKLNRDNKEYVDAMNLLADPTNLELIFQSNMSAAEAIRKKFLDEHLDELADETGITTKELTKHDVVESADGTFVVKFKGEEVASGFATEEEAQAEADRLDVLTAENFTKEEEARIKKADWVNNLSSIKDELNKLKTKEEKLQWLADNNYLDPFTQDDESSNYLKTATGRVVVKIKIGKITIPFYISTGSGEKADVQINKWYVFFGQGKDGWFNKTSGKDINEQYDVEIFKDIASILNDVGSNKDEYKNHEDDKGYMKLKWTGLAEEQLHTVIDFITPIQPNSSPDGPKATPEQLAQLRLNIQTVKDRVAAELKDLENKPAAPIVNTAAPTELVPTEAITVNSLVEKMNNAKSIADLEKLHDDLINIYVDILSDDELNTVLASYEKQYDKLIKEETNAAAAAGKKYLSKDDPEFTQEYDLTLKQIADIVNKIGVTVDDVEAAFKLINNSLNKLDPTVRKEFIKELRTNKENIINKVRAENRAKDVASAKSLITKNLSNDAVPIEESVENLFNTLNVILKSEFKAEVIEHFEKEYAKAIDKKINQLNSLANIGTSSQTLTSLLNVSKSFRDKIQKSMDTFAAKTEELAKIKGVTSFIVPEDGSFSTFIHRSISASTKAQGKSASVPQRQAISAFLQTGLLSQEDVEATDLRQDASVAINLAVGRIYTLQINKAAKEFYKTGDSKDLETILVKYFSEKLDQKESESLEDAKIVIESRDAFDSVSDFIVEAIQIPEVPEISKEQYTALNEYRSAVFTLMSNSAVIESLDTINKEQQKVVLAGGKSTAETVITKDLITALEPFIKSVNGSKDVAKFREALVQSFDTIKNSKNITEANAVIQKILKEHIDTKKSLNGIGLGILQSVYSSTIQAQNLLETEDDGAAPLSEEQMIVILDNPKQSLNKQQIAQVEDFAKTEQLEKHKRKLNAAVGYTSDPITFVPAALSGSAVTNTFSSLRPKVAEDKRTAKDLAMLLKPDAEGKVTTKNALAFIIASEFATPQEKELARKLMPATAEEDFITIDNSLKSAGEYDADENEIFINLDTIGFKEDRQSPPLETVILHELMHSVIEKAIVDPASEYHKAIKDLYNIVKKNEAAKTFYAYQEGLTTDQQLHEFVVEAFTNPSFQQLLAKTPLDKMSNQSIWDRFMEVLSDILTTFGIDMKDTVLSEVLSLTKGLYNPEKTLDAEAVMDKIAFASTEEALNEILKEIEADRVGFDEETYNKLVAAVRSKVETVTGPIKFAEAIKGLTPIKIGKTVYYYTNATGDLQVFKKVKFKLSAVKKQDVIDQIKEKITKGNPIQPTQGVVNFTIASDLANKDYKEDLTALDFAQVSEGMSKTAVEKRSLRSTSFDGIVNDEGVFEENEEFVNYYHKVRDIINTLSTQPLENLSGLYVTMVKDNAGLHWDGSAQSESWKELDSTNKLGVVGYISDEDGNPIVFDKEGHKIGRADKANPVSSQFNTGDNQIVYFNIVKKYTGGDRQAYDKITAAREAAMQGKTQIAPLQKVSMGQMNLKSLVKSVTLNQKNTARDKELQKMLAQDHVKLELNGQFLNAVITDSKGGVNRTALFPPVSKAVKITTPQGTYTMFDHLFELMKVYNQLQDDNYSRIGDIKSKLVDFAYNMWLTGYNSKSEFRGLKIPQTFDSITIQVKNTEGNKVPVRLVLFTKVNGVITINEDNLKKVKAYVDNMKINIDKTWLETGKFNFPYITEEDNKKMINFEEKDYRDFLINEAGLSTYINEIPADTDIKRYNSIVHFSEPRSLDSKPSGVAPVSDDTLIKNPDAVKDAVDKAIKDAPTAKDKKVRETNRRFGTPSYDQIFEKICK